MQKTIKQCATYIHSNNFKNIMLNERSQTQERMKFYNRRNEHTSVEIRTRAASKGCDRLEEASWDFYGMLEVFYILTEVWITHVYAFAKIKILSVFLCKILKINVFCFI